MTTPRLSAKAYTADPRHGPLPAILILLTISTGVVDATSILGLGRVFVANMTGNIVFIGFALAGAPGFSLWGSVTALAAFLVGAAIGGVLVSRATHRGRLLCHALVPQTVLVAIAVVIAAVSVDPTAQLLILAAIALALGVQNAVVRSLAVPDMTTTVLTMTLTGIAADLRKGDIATAVRRIVAVLAMLAGAFLGACLVLRWGVLAGLVVILALLIGALIAASISSRSSSPWTTLKV
jgi:uncharacterized membrane protein YoaK (UPF0700 family)